MNNVKNLRLINRLTKLTKQRAQDASFYMLPMLLLTTKA